MTKYPTTSYTQPQPHHNLLYLEKKSNQTNKIKENTQTSIKTVKHEQNNTISQEQQHITLHIKTQKFQSNIFLSIRSITRTSIKQSEINL